MLWVYTLHNQLSVGSARNYDLVQNNCFVTSALFVLIPEHNIVWIIYM